MGKEAERDKAIMSQIIKLHKKIDYLTDQVMDRLDKMIDEESQKDFPFAPIQPKGITEIRIKEKGNNE